MSKLPKTENLRIPGPAGTLEALLESPQGREAGGSAVVCHPHPEHGGTMQNKVVHTLARAFVARGYAALRFNFRGVGGSAGEFDAGEGEVQDALAMVQAMRERHGESNLWLAGFSFGAAIAIRAAAEARPDGLISVAPAVSRVSQAAAGGRRPRCPWLIIQGDRDELVPVSDTIAWLNELEPGPELQILPGAEHFFHGRLVELRHAVEAFIDAQRATQQP
jgi:alpha/beta superfamily hydrolase